VRSLRSGIGNMQIKFPGSKLKEGRVSSSGDDLAVSSGEARTMPYDEIFSCRQFFSRWSLSQYEITVIARQSSTSDPWLRSELFIIKGGNLQMLRHHGRDSSWVPRFVSSLNSCEADTNGRRFIRYRFRVVPYPLNKIE